MKCEDKSRLVFLFLMAVVFFLYGCTFWPERIVRPMHNVLTNLNATVSEVRTLAQTTTVVVADLNTHMEEIKCNFSNQLSLIVADFSNTTAEVRATSHFARGQDSEGQLLPWAKKIGVAFGLLMAVIIGRLTWVLNKMRTDPAYKKSEHVGKYSKRTIDFLSNSVSFFTNLSKK
jgi:hypothetical protein